MTPLEFSSLSNEYAVSLFPRDRAPLCIRVFAEDRYQAIESAWRVIGFVELDNAQARLI